MSEPGGLAPRAHQVFSRPSSIWGWFVHPYVQICIGAMLVTASELLLRHGAAGFADARGAQKWLGIAALASRWTWLGILCYIASFASWIHVLRFVPLSIAFPVINIVHVLVPVGSWAFLGEAISARRWAGIGLVVAGILLLVQPFVKAEETL
jgi:multidrug transporter EmrE-like cation transporter